MLISNFYFIRLEHELFLEKNKISYTAILKSLTIQ
jgi:hypothetical protein